MFDVCINKFSYIQRPNAYNPPTDWRVSQHHGANERVPETPEHHGSKVPRGFKGEPGPSSLRVSMIPRGYIKGKHNSEEFEGGHDFEEFKWEHVKAKPLHGEPASNNPEELLPNLQDATVCV